MRYNQITPGSWPARRPMNPVVPTTVNRNAACITEIYQISKVYCNPCLKVAIERTPSNLEKLVGTCLVILISL